MMGETPKFLGIIGILKKNLNAWMHISQLLRQGDYMRRGLKMKISRRVTKVN